MICWYVEINFWKSLKFPFKGYLTDWMNGLDHKTKCASIWGRTSHIIFVFFSFLFALFSCSFLDCRWLCVAQICLRPVFAQTRLLRNATLTQVRKMKHGVRTRLIYCFPEGLDSNWNHWSRWIPETIRSKCREIKLINQLPVFKERKQLCRNFSTFAYMILPTLCK